MQDLYTQLAKLRRPRILITAARHGTRDYERGIHLRRLLKSDALPHTGEAVVRLMEMERDLDDARRTHAGHYRLATYVEVLIALMSEARVLRSI